MAENTPRDLMKSKSSPRYEGETRILKPRMENQHSPFRESQIKIA